MGNSIFFFGFACVTEVRHICKMFGSSDRIGEKIVFLYFVNRFKWIYFRLARNVKAHDQEFRRLTLIETFQNIRFS